MTLTQLSYIVAVDKFKNFGVAAQNCGVTQPTLSMQIQKMEEEIGLILFDRSEQPIRTTKIGDILIKQAKVVLREHSKLNELISEDKDETRGEIRLGVIPTLAPYLMPLFIKSFAAANPNLKIIVEELQTAQILKKIDDTELDLGLLVTPIDHDGLISHPLFYEPFLAYVSEKSPLMRLNRIEQKELSSNDLWLLADGHCFREQSLLLCRNRKKASDMNKNIRFESGSLETLRKMVDQESGFTLLPFLATQDIKNSKRLKEFVNPAPSREVSLIHNSFFRKEKIKASLISTIQKSLPKEIPQTVTKNMDVLELPIGKI
ncbi:MAG: transcriptional regulator [Bdellovibrionales bacterium RIFCSPHIGHO2_01_FULL_40_29]|nr:MAG: transcriptional regulator [Bdellovibrionales bacterium RIFCSPHIGHO2_01_FULL_40_29]OFZ35346.1 MAG: transcriptional regulator [Bdellovibrionales bacterium RIFCSPHIGHO2_02_FULL_40_15]